MDMDKENLIRERNIAFAEFFGITEIILYYAVCRGGATGEADFSMDVNKSLGVLAKDILSDLQTKDREARSVLSEEEIEEGFYVCGDPELKDAIEDLIAGKYTEEPA